MSEIELCGLCGKAPHVYPIAVERGESHVARCLGDCANARRSFWLPEWNDAQRAFMAVRRKDFESARDINPKDTTPDYGDFYYLYDTFEDYVAGKETLESWPRVALAEE